MDFNTFIDSLIARFVLKTYFATPNKTVWGLSPEYKAYIRMDDEWFPIRDFETTTSTVRVHCERDVEETFLLSEDIPDDRLRIERHGQPVDIYTLLG